MSAPSSDWYENLGFLISIVTVIINIVLTFIYWLKNNDNLLKRRVKEAEYQSRLFLFQEFIAKNLGKHLAFAGSALIILRKVTNETTIQIDDIDTLRSTITDSIDKLDAVNNDFRVNTVLLTRGYSTDCFKLFDDNLTEFYDAITNDISKCSSLNSSTLSIRIQSILNEADDHEEKYIKNLLEIADNSRPKLNFK